MDESTLVGVIQSESQRLSQYLNALPADSWLMPSACACWEVRDVVAHLDFVAEFYNDVISRGVRGDTLPPKGFPGIDRPDRSTFDEYIAEEALARRRRLGEQLLTTFSMRWDHLNQLMGGLAPAFQLYQADCACRTGWLAAMNSQVCPCRM